MASTISRLGAECRGRANLLINIIPSCRNEKQVPNGSMSTAVDPKLDIDKRVICWIHQLVCWFSKTKTIHYDEEQIRNSPASSSHGQRRPVVWQVTVNS